MRVTETADEVGANLAGLESVWDGSMSKAYAFFRHQVRPVARGESPLEAGAPGNPGHQHPPEVALAAALVESAAALQDLGGTAPEPAQLLLGDLCLARASRLLAETGDTRLQVAFALAVERVAAEAAGGPASQGLRELLVAAITGQR